MKRAKVSAENQVGANKPDLATLSIKELLEIKEQWFDQADDRGVFEMLQLISAELGRCRPGGDGNYYTFEDDPLKIVWQPCHSSTRVILDGRVVCETHPEVKLFVPGDWVELVVKYHRAALARKEQRAAEEAERERQDLIAQLGGAELASPAGNVTDNVCRH